MNRFVAATAITVALSASSLWAAEAPYPFEGTWVRAERACTATTSRTRTYTAKEVTSPRGRCAIRRVAANANTFEMVEECHRDNRPSTVTETIRLTSPDTMMLKRQVSRLKIPRQVRYARCTIAAGVAGRPTGRPVPLPESKPH